MPTGRFLQCTCLNTDFRPPARGTTTRTSYLKRWPSLLATRECVAARPGPFALRMRAEERGPPLAPKSGYWLRDIRLSVFIAPSGSAIRAAWSSSDCRVSSSFLTMIEPRACDHDVVDAW
jgi:hypothetical protein